MIIRKTISSLTSKNLKQQHNTVFRSSNYYSQQRRYQMEKKKIDDEFMDGTRVLMRDHRHMDDIFKKFESSNSKEEKKKLVNEMIRQISIHTVIEEQYLYPFVRNKLVDGNKLSEHGIKEHREMKQMLERLDSMDDSDPNYNGLVLKVIKDTRHHNYHDEEGEIFPKMRDCSTKEELIELGNNLENAKKYAPLRPHPNATDEAPWNKFTGPALHLVDKVSDIGRSFPMSLDDQEKVKREKYANIGAPTEGSKST